MFMLSLLFYIIIVLSLFSAMRNVFLRKTNEYSHENEYFIYGIFVLEFAFYILIAAKFSIIIGIFAALCYIGYTLLLTQYLCTKKLIFSPQNKISYYTRICEIILYTLILINLIIK